MRRKIRCDRWKRKYFGLGWEVNKAKMIKRIDLWKGKYIASGGKVIKKSHSHQHLLSRSAMYMMCSFVRTLYSIAF
jgi:hypothetical protein